MKFFSTCPSFCPTARKILLLALLAAILSASRVTSAQVAEVRNWNTGTGDWFSSDSWLTSSYVLVGNEYVWIYSNVVPGVNDTASINNGGTAVIAGNGAVSEILSIGNSGSGALNINGGVLTTTQMANLNAGAVRVAGHGAIWNIGANNGGSLYVGGYGASTLDITNGGATTVSGPVFVGYSLGSSGVVTVDGFGSTWNTGFLTVSASGNAILNISNGGNVNSAGASISGRGGAFQAPVVTVAGAGSIWNNTATLEIDSGGALNVTDGGTINASIVNGANLTISNGGVVNSSSAYLAGNVTTVDGAHSTWNNSGALVITNFGNSSLSVTNGATLNTGALSNSGTFVHTGQGLVTVNGDGTNSTNGTMTVDGDVSVKGNFNNYGQVTQIGGTHAISGTLHVGGGAVYTLQGGRLNPLAMNIDTGGNLAIMGQGQNIWTYTASISNAGTISMRGNPGGWIETQTYTQSSTGTLEVSIGSAGNSQVIVSSTASLAGTLNVDLQGGFVPTVGQTFRVMSYSNVVGRFDTFNGSIIPNDPKHFLGLSYGANALSVTTLNVPLRTNLKPLSSQGGQGLILITHGWNASAADPDWVTMSQHIQAKTISAGHGSWDVVTMDWSQYSHTGLDTKQAALNANDIGWSLANWMNAMGYNYQNVHLIAHSAGAWLINSFADNLSQNDPGVFIHDTFLDAYNPSNLPLQGYDATNFPVLGKNADFAEQFYSGVNGGIDGLATILPKAMNWNVWSIYPGQYVVPIVTAHAWPIQWYSSTVLDPYGISSVGGNGFAVSLEYSGSYPVYTLSAKQGTWRGLLPSGKTFNQTNYGTPVNPLAGNHVSTGSVQPDGANGIVLSTASLMPAVVAFAAETPITPATATPSGPAVMISSEMDLAQTANLLTLTGQFSSSGHGLLSLYIDGSEILQVDEQAVGSAQWSSGDLYLASALDPGIHTLLLRLDPYDGLDSTVNVSNVQFGLATTVEVPEPASLVVLASGIAVVLVTWKRPRKIRNL